MRAALEKEARWKTALSWLVVVVLTPITVWAGTVFGSGSYYVTSILVIIYAMVPFFVSFESRRPQARELVIIAVMCALAVVARVAFIWVPHFKPIAAIVMIAGVALGSRLGFLVGAISLLVSDFVFGQGPWTPWQMLAYGTAGFVAGFLAERGVIPRSDLSNRAKTLLSLAGAAFVVVVVGPILDTCSLFTMVSAITPESALAIYASGLPVNAVQATATAITLFILANPLLGKLERVRVKYGLAR